MSTPQTKHRKASSSSPPNYDVVVVGGGLAGLTAAATLKGRGLSVLVLERSSQLGGRAGTREDQGFRLNWGPHALYRGHIATKVLHELGVRFTGKTPNPSGAYAIYAGRKEILPGGFLSLLSTGLLGVSGKLELAKLLATLAKITFDAGAELLTSGPGCPRRSIRTATTPSAAKPASFTLAVSTTTLSLPTNSPPTIR